MIKAKKKFGQNFLSDQSVVKEILNYLKPLGQDKVLEIGPGMGAITIPLLSELNHISVIEIDPDMINYLQKKIPESKINFINRDVLSINNKELEVYERIIGNLPYYISTEILIKMIDIVDSLNDIHFMFQKEVAERITAKPKSKNFGRLSVLIQYFFEAEILFDISANSFSPPPKIQSSFIKLIPKKKEGLKFKNFNNFKKVIKTAFQFKRKTLKNNFKDILGEDNFNSIGINSQKRAEMLSIDDFVNIENYIYDHKIII
jgi:16S rRNA (adenine1518-N6/adenine1519-N6)-dimethyltransferase